MTVKAGVVIISGTLLAQSFAPTCAAHDGVCDLLAEPPHVHQEVPRGAVYVVSRAPVWSSNVAVGISYVRIAADIKSPETSRDS